MIEQLAAALRDAGTDLDWRDLADAMWLYHARGTSPPVATADAQPDASEAAAPAASPAQPGGEPGTAEPAPGTAEPDAQPPALERGPTRDDGSFALDVRVPRRHALPGRLEIGRALRPFKQSRRSTRRFVFDTEATVDHYCDTKVLVPITAPARERWFRDVALVVDASPTMAAWRDTITAVAELLERLGAFGRVTHWTLDGDGQEVYLRSGTGLRHDPHELVDYDGRRLVLVATDCVSPLWYGPAVWAMLRDWGDSVPVALLQMLPARLWQATALGEADVAIASRGRGEANRQLAGRPPWWWDEDGPPAHVTPVITLDPDRLRDWAAMVMGAGGVEVAGVITEPPAGEAGPQAGPADPAALVATFRATVSGQAARLTSLLSAVEVSLPVAQLVLDSLIPEPSQTHLAEVLAGGLLRQAEPGSDLAGPPSYEFLPGVREILQDSLTTSAVIDVWRTVAPYLEAATGERPPFSRLLAAPGVGLPPDTAATALGQIATGVIGRLGLLPPSPGTTGTTAGTGLGERPGLAATAPAPERRPLRFVGISESSLDSQPGTLANVFASLGVETTMLEHPTSEQVSSTLSSLTDTDAVVIYWSGQCLSMSANLYLVVSDGGQPETRPSVIPYGDLVYPLPRAGVKQLMLILDVTMHEAKYETPSPSRLTDWIGILTAARGYSAADSADLSETIQRLLIEGPRGYRRAWSAHNERISGEDFIDALLEEWPRTRQRPGISRMYGRSTPFLPNPRYDPSAPARSVESLLAQIPVSTGLGGEYFMGRQRSVDKITQWLAANRTGLLVVTGPARSGKTALIFRAIGPSGIDAALNASGMSREMLTAALGDLRLGPVSSIPELTERLAVLKLNPSVVVDSVDEAAYADLAGIAQDLRDLGTQARVIVGTRDVRLGGGLSLVALLGARTEVVDLADDPISEAEIRAYLERRLEGGDVARTAEAAELLANVARPGRGSGTAMMLANSILARSGGVIGDDWRDRLNEAIIEIFHRDLERPGAPGEHTAGDLLTCLAWSFGQGLPAREVWPELASSLRTGAEYGDSDIQWVLSTFGQYIVEAAQGGEAVYRLYHQALVDYLRADAAQGRRIDLAAGSLFLRQSDDGLRPGDASPYLRSYVRDHLVRAGKRGQPMVSRLPPAGAPEAGATPGRGTTPGRRGGEPAEGDADLIVIIPGFAGSTLVRDGKEVWSVSAGALVRAVFNRGQNIRHLTLPAGLGDDHPRDGIHPGRLLPYNSGYDKLIRRVRQLPWLRDNEGPFTFPYDWRLSHRYTARRLAEFVLPLLEERWASGRTDARLRLVCFGEGGLVARWYLDHEQGAWLTRQLVTIGTPLRGTLYALDRLVNGQRSTLSDAPGFTELIRSLPSWYQTLPAYPCIDQGGTLHGLFEVNVPGLDDAAMVDGLRFLAGLAEQPTAIYTTHSIVGVGQPTPVLARLVDGQLIVISDREDTSMDGDGVVPRLSAMPSSQRFSTSISERHANLLSNAAVQNLVYDALATRLALAT